MPPKGEHRVCAWASQAGVAFTNPFTSELAQDFENTSPLALRAAPLFSSVSKKSRIKMVKIRFMGTDGKSAWSIA